MASPFSQRLSTDTPEQDASTKDRSTPADGIPLSILHVMSKLQCKQFLEVVPRVSNIPYCYCPKAKRNNICLLECTYL